MAQTSAKRSRLIAVAGIGVALLGAVTAAVPPASEGLNRGPRRPVTYGSIIQLEHQDTRNQLSSIPKVTWRHGGQIVSGIPGAAEATELESMGWIVRSKGSASDRLTGDDVLAFSTFTHASKDDKVVFKVKDSGTPVKCGDIIRLEHEASGKNLHSHLEKAQLSQSHEVIGFGQAGHGDSNDWFKVECTNSGNDTWHTREPVSLRHMNLNGLLTSQAAYEFNEYNCPRCPITGHTEVFVSKKKRSESSHLWMAKSIMRVSLTEDDDLGDEGDFGKDEL